MDYTTFLNHLFRILTLIGLFIYIFRKTKNKSAIYTEQQSTDYNTLENAINSLKQIQVIPSLDYSIPTDINNQLINNLKNQKALYNLLLSMTEHLHIDGHFITLYVHDNKNARFPGLYTVTSDGKVTITLQIQDNYTLNTIVAILAHELMHMYLDFKNVKHPVKKLNEILTDTAAVYFGFGNYIYNSMRDGKERNYKIGYINIKDLEYIKRICQKSFYSS